jgi:TonB-dependent starch-binding outer membrane protein SusC
MRVKIYFFVDYSKTKCMRKKLFKIPICGTHVLKIFSVVICLSTGQIVAGIRHTMPEPLLAEVQQSVTVTGQIISEEDGMPLPGVTISVKGNPEITATTDLDGKYSIEVRSSDSILVFSYTGYKTQEEVIPSSKELNIVLKTEVTVLDEIIMVGYGTQKKSDLTGAVVRANIDDFRQSPNTNVAQMLQGTTPGLNIGQVTSSGATPSINIRGNTTISGNSSVVIVLDGIIYNNTLESINPNDIKSIDILKDASAKAVYGAQANNGVIIITTKRGSKGKTSVSFSSAYSVQEPSRNLRMMNRKEMLDFVQDKVMWNQAYTEASGYTQPNPDFNLAAWMPDSYMVDSNGEIISTDFDWWDAATRRGTIADNKLSFSGGSENVSYLVSLGNVTQRNYLVNDDFKRNSIRLNLDANLRPWWKIGVQAFGSFVNKDGQEPTLWTLLSMNPLTTPYNEDGTLNPLPMETARDNPLMGSDVADRDRQNYFFANLYTEFKLPIEGLTYRINFGNNFRYNEHFYASKYGFSQAGLAYKEHSFYTDYTFDNIVSYNKDFGKHGIAATLLYGAIERKYAWTRAEANTFDRLTLGYNSLEQGKNQFTFSDANREALLYQMARVNYNYDGRYLLTATIRRDGYSGFADTHKTAYFPSLALGWILSDEPFYKIPWMNNLKLRGGWGISGNQTNMYASQSRVTSGIGYIFGDGGTGVIRQELASLGNSGLRWERTPGFNAGIDFAFLNNRITASVDAYKTRTYDLLYNVAIPTITGFSSITSNIGELKNQGVEFSLTSQQFDSENFSWSTTFNFSTYKNKVVTLTGYDSDGDGVEDDLTASNLFIGKDISSIYGYVVDGIYQIGDDIPTGYSAGNYKIRDINGDGEITTDDRKVIGKTNPAYTFSVLNKLSYKNFSLTFFINSVQGGKNGYLGLNYAAITQDDNSRRFNRISEMADKFWSPNNPGGIYSSSVTSGAITPKVYQDRSFIRLQDVTLGYNVPKTISEHIGVDNINLFVNGKNLFIITKWDGWDPEANVGSVDGISNTGSNYDGRPVMRSITGGINVTF